MKAAKAKGGVSIVASHVELGDHYLHCGGAASLLFTENETNNELLFRAPNNSPYVKDGINDYVVHGREDAVNPLMTGTKASANYKVTVAPGATEIIRLRLSDKPASEGGSSFGKDFDAVFEVRLKEADEFYRSIAPPNISEDEARVMRQALAGMLWTKQYYFLDADKWLEDRSAHPLHGGQRVCAEQRMVPHAERSHHLHARQVGVSMVRSLGPCLSYRRAVGS